MLGTNFRRILPVALALLALSSAAVVAETASARGTVTISAQNGLERDILAALNEVRAAHKLPPLRHAPSLAAAADAHSKAMGRLGFFAHESKDGNVFWKRIQRYYGKGDYRTWSVGENLLWSSPTIDAPGAVKMWMDSPPHRRNILDRSWREVGLSAISVAGAGGVYGGRDVIIVTSNFGARL